MDNQSDDELIREAAQRFLRDHHSFRLDRMSALADCEESKARWRQFADMGWLGLAFPESEGGIGMSSAAVAALMEEFGRALVLEPYIGGVLLAGHMILRVGSQAQRATYLGSLFEGKERFALAHQEVSWNSTDISSTATPTEAGWRLSGRKSFVLGGAVADLFLVSAHANNELNLFVVPRSADGLNCQVFRAIDGSLAADVDLNNVVVPDDARLEASSAVSAALAESTAIARAAACADAVGAMMALLDATVAYTQTRQQFGQPLARYQALQHRMARMAILCEESRTASLYAASRLAGSYIARDRANSAAKAKVGAAARWVAQQAVQLHGGIGMTSELPIGWLAKRLLMFEGLLGTTREHLNVYAMLLREAAIGTKDVLTIEGSA